MSVINKMLQDLENRETPPSLNNHYVAPVSSFYSNKMWLFAVLAIVLAGAAFGLFYMSRGPAQEHKSVVSLQSAAESTQSPVTRATTPQAEEKVSETRLIDQQEEALTDDSPVSLQTETLTYSEDSLENNTHSSLALAANNVDDSDLLLDSQATKAHVQAPAIVDFSEPKVGPEPHRGQGVVEETELSHMTVTKSADAVETVSLQTRIEQAIQQGDTMQSIALLQQLAEQEPDDMSVIKKLAAQQFAAGQITQAMATLEQAKQQFSNAPSLLLMLSRLYQHQGEENLAWETIAKAGGTDTELLSYRATLASSLKNYEAARQDYRQLLLIEPTQARWWLGLAVANDKLSYAHDALLAYRRVLQHGGVNSNVEAFVRNRIAVLAEGSQ